MKTLKINSLRLKSIRCYNDDILKFDSGKNIITGANGSGKSTIINSIGLALFGQNYLTNFDLNYNDFITNGKDKGRIILDFSTDKGNFQSEFLIQRKGSNKWVLYEILEDEKRKEVTKLVSETKNYVLNLFDGMLDATTFKNAICSPQGQISKIMDATDSERAGEIYKVLNVEKYKDVANLTRKLLRLIDEKQEKTTSYLEGLGDVDAGVSQFENKLKEEEKSLKSLTINLQENLKNHEGLATNLIAIQSKITKKNELSTQIRSIQEQIEDSKKVKTQAQKSLKDKFAGLNQTNLNEIEVKRDITKLNSEKKIIDAELINVIEKEKEFKLLTENSKRLESRFNELKTDQRSVTTKLNKLKSDISSLIDSKDVTLENLQNFTKAESDFLNTKIKEEKEYIQSIQSKSESKTKKLTQKEGLENKIAKSENEFKREFDLDPSNTDTEIQNKEKLLKEIDKKTEEVNLSLEEISIKRGELNNKIKQTNDVLKLLKHTHETEKTCPTCRQSLQGVDLKSLTNIHQKELESANKAIKDILTSENKLKLEYRKLEEQQKKISKEHLKLQNFAKIFMELREDNTRITELTESISIIDDELSKLNNEHQSIQTLLEDSMRKVDLAKGYSKDLQNSLKEDNKLTKDLKMIEEELSENSKKIAQIDFNRLQKEKAQLETKQEKLTSSIDKLQELLPLFVRIQTLTASIDSNQAIILNKRMNLDEILKELPSDSEIEKLILEERELDNTISGLKERIKILSNEILPELKANLNSYLELRKDRDDKESLRQRYILAQKEFSEVYRIMDILPEKIVSAALARVSNNATKIIQKLMPEKGFNQIQLSPNGQLIVVRQGEEIRYNQISGGEKTALAIALRAALSQSVVQVNFMILDEPTQHLDKNRVEELIEIMDKGDLLGNKNGQLILVTHVDEFTRIADQSIKIEVANSGKRTFVTS